MEVLGSDIEDFFFGCNIRGISSTPYRTKERPGSGPGANEVPFEEQAEPPLKTLKVWLEFPIEQTADYAGYD